MVMVEPHCANITLVIFNIVLCQLISVPRMIKAMSSAVLKDICKILSEKYLLFPPILANWGTESSNNEEFNPFCLFHSGIFSIYILFM